MVWSSLFFGQGKTADPFQWLMPPAREPKREVLAVKKETDVSCYLLDVTRKALLSFTTSLTKVSTQVHSFFSGLSQYLAFERLMRACFGWAMPATPFSAAPATPQFWPMITSFWFPAIAQPAPQPQPQPKPFSWWGGGMLEAPKPQAPVATPLGMADAGMPMYSAAMAMTSAMFSFAPTVMRPWGLA